MLDTLTQTPLYGILLLVLVIVIGFTLIKSLIKTALLIIALSVVYVYYLHSQGKPTPAVIEQLRR